MKGKLIKATINLFCLPFAGGNRYSYQKYLENASPLLKIIPVEYPGRGSRVMEPQAAGIHELVDDLYHRVSNSIDHSDYAIYGHSMGGLVGYLLARKLIDRNHRLPLHLFITGASAPSSPARAAVARHSLPRKELIEELKRLDGTPDELLYNEDLLEYISPIVRADFKICEEYQYVQLPPLKIPFTVVTGEQEGIETADVHLWQKETECDVDFIKMPGRHFFIFQEPNAIMNIISEKLFVSNNVVSYE